MVRFSFENKVAIITGAGIGIGFEIVKQLALAGASVLLNDIDESVANKAAKAIQKEGGNCIAMAGDSSDITNIQKMINTAVEKFGRLDYAIANAGITTFGGFLDYQLDDFQRLSAVNLQGSFFLAQAAARQIIKQQSSGRILFMSSVTGHQAHSNLAAYGMTKAALEMLAKNLGVELAPHKITVNAIAPGATMTERTRELDPNYEQIWQNITPTGNVSTTKDVASSALFLLSDSSSQITGQSIIVDGGWTSVSPQPE